ncbi:CUP2_2 [Sanghuangporus sanghuang]
MLGHSVPLDCGLVFTHEQVVSPFNAGGRWLKNCQLEPLELLSIWRGYQCERGEWDRYDEGRAWRPQSTTLGHISGGKTLKLRCHLTLQFKWRQFTSGCSTNLHAIGAIGNTGLPRSAGTHHVQMAQTSLFPLLLPNRNSSRHSILNKAVHEANSLLRSHTWNIGGRSFAHKPRKDRINLFTHKVQNNKSRVNIINTPVCSVVSFFSYSKYRLIALTTPSLPPSLTVSQIYARLMVYVNSKKYACESCIKGHRSSSCHHNDRPLYEIKKKGRPVSQCERCREARQSRRIHAKCTCDSEKCTDATPSIAEGKRKQGKRFIPTIPSLPNGLKDALKASSSAPVEANVPKQPVDALLNPCHCKDVYNCKCRARVVDSGIRSEPHPRKPVDPAIFNDGLSALALVAACCAPATPSQFAPTVHKEMNQTLSAEKAGTSVHIDIDQKAESRTSGTSKRKRSPRSSPVPPEGNMSDVNKATPKVFRQIAPAPPETHTTSWSSSASSYPYIPAPTPPPILHASSNVVASTEVSTGLANAHATSADVGGSHCCCGTRCECAGCELHGPAPTSRPSWVDDPAEAGPSTVPAVIHGQHNTHCADDCSTCVDYDGGIELPPLSSIPGVPSTSQESPTPSYLAAFYARAASLPAPPAKSRSSLDPTNVTIYPQGLFNRPRVMSESSANLDEEDEERPRAFGLVRIPKLEECCAGRCRCPEDSCGCGDMCDGCCMDDGEKDDTEDGGEDSRETSVLRVGPRLSPSVSFARKSLDDTPRSPAVVHDAPAPRACCARP